MSTLPKSTLFAHLPISRRTILSMVLISVLAFSVGSNAHANGCTHTHGYWLSHSDLETDYDNTWDIIGGPSAPFFNSNQSWVQALNTQPKGGNAYYILAHQYIATRLNYYAGAAPLPLVIDEALTNSALLLDQPHFASCAGDACVITTKTDSQDFSDAIQNANLLSLYNRGLIGPGSCSK